MKKVCIFIPAYNEEESIGTTIDEINKVTRNLKNYKFEVIVSNNNSKDKTGEIAKKHRARVVFEKKQGYGYAYKKGLSEAKGDIVITGDADATYPFSDIPRFLRVMEEGKYDLIIGNRFYNLDKKTMTLLNHFGNFLLTLATNLIYGVKINDSQSGMIAFNKNYLDKLNLDLLSNGMPLCQELKLYAICFGMKITEIPIIYRARIGKTKLKPLKDGLDNLISLLKFKRKIQKYITYLKNKNQ